MNIPAGVAVFLTIFGANASQAWEIKTDGRPVKLLELYTSEGCSSCPPAERWLSARRKDPQLWKTFVPVSFHVDYWDGLGWPDRFARPSFTERQRSYAATWGSGSVYTPAVVCSGVEQRDWPTLQPGRDGSGGGFRLIGELSARLEQKSVGIRFEPAISFAGGNVTLAWLGVGLTSDVRAGENRGERLTHDFVALATVAAPLSRDADGAWTASLPASAPAEATAVAVWIQRPGDPSPVQAAGGWLAP